MSKKPRITGTVLPFASEAAPQERTVFGQNVISDDINLQQTVEYLRGWGIVGPSEFPSMQDFSALGFTLSSLVAYLYEQGMPEYDATQPYFIGGFCGQDGVIYSSIIDNNLGNDPSTDDGSSWTKVLDSSDASSSATPGKLALRNAAGTFQVSAPTAASHPSRKQDLDEHKNAVDAHTAANIDYSNASSGLAATKVQSAIDETLGRLVLVEDVVYEQRAASVTWNMETDTYSGSPRATPVHESMRRCLVSNTGVVNYYLNEFDSTKKENGIDPAVTNGTDGQIMVEISVPAYVRTTFNGSLVTWELSHVPLPGFELHPAYDGDAGMKHYIGAYDAVVWQASSATVIDGLNLDNNAARVNLSNDRLYSTPGNFAMVGLTRNEFRTLARNGGFQLYEFWQWQLVQMLFITEYGNWNSQNVLGRGNVDGGTWPPSSSNQANSLNKVNGLSSQFGNYSGSVASADGLPFVTYRGIENIWGNSWQAIDGVNANNRQLYVSTKETTFADDIGTGDYSVLGSPLPVATDSPIKNWQPIDHAFVPKAVGATTSTFIGDSLWTAVGWTVLHVGGSADDGLSAGLSACIATYAASYRNRHVSSRLSKKLRS